MGRTANANRIDVYLEAGKKRVFAGAVDWPGWCRSARDEPAALQSLLDYWPRYARVLRDAHLELHAPARATDFRVVERLTGDATTDFGSPGAPPSADARPIDDGELRRLQGLLEACWRALDAAVSAAAVSGRELRKGPRGGGRDTQEIARHVLDAEVGYLSRLGQALPPGEESNLGRQQDFMRRAVLDALMAAPRDGVPQRGPRGGKRWTPRYFARRVAWHALDHAWEIEDRMEPNP